MFAASKTAAAADGAPPPPSTDPDFNYVTMLLHGDGTNGAQNNTFLDSSTNNFTITRTGTPTQGSFSPYGDLWSNFFSGSGQYLTTASSGTATGDFTYEAWVYPTTATLGVVIAVGSETTARALMFVSSTQQLTFDVFSVGTFTLGGTVTLNQWSHIAIVRSGTTVRGYLNGTVLGTTGTYASTAGNANGFAVGASKTGGSPFAGYISNARVVNGTAVYTANFTPSTTPLTAITNTSLLTCQSNRFRDNSSNNFSITATGTPSVQRFSPFDPAAAYSTSVIGGSGYFAGATNYLTVPDNNAFTFDGDFTIEAWVYRNTTGNHVIVAHWPGLLAINCSFSLAIYSSNFISFAYGIGGSNINIAGTSASAPLNQWNHVAVTRSGTTVRLFVNGVQDSTTATVSGALNNSTAVLTVGVQNTGDGLYFNGYISNLRLVKGTALYTSNFTPPTAPLTAITNTSLLLLNNVNAGIFDNAMMNNLVTVGNAQVSTAVKKYGTGSMAFDGSGDWLTSPYTPQADFGAGNFTVEGWVYITSNSPAEQFLYGKRANNTAYAPLVVGVSKSGTVYRSFYVGSFTGASWGLNSSFARGTIDIPLNTWVHLAVVRNGSTFTSYVNGVADLTFTGLSSALMTNTDVVTIGAHSTSGSAPWFGYIDDLRITKGIARYTANFTAPTAAFPNN